MNDDFDKYLAIANHDIQMAKNMGELKSYVASLLYDNDKKVEILQQKENIIKEVREYIEKHLEREYFDYDILEANTIYNRDLYKVLKILDKENK